MIMICMIWSRKVVKIELNRNIFVKIFSLKNCLPLILTVSINLEK